ncbi:MAG: phosphatidylglycerophosphatase A [Phycisphaerales bacterium]|jgi:phosphatidylglycerophosphatase A|nr:phosphatidylglycerophosphatase A [Phycisphaerales bacterium]
MSRHSANGLRLITVFGLGFMRPASGTWGSMPPVLAAATLIALGFAPGTSTTSSLVYHAALAVVFVIFAGACIVQGDRAEARFGHDPSEVVADEVAGQCVALLALPAAALATPSKAALTLATSFFAFRVLDIVKPWPAGQLQRVPSGWGILLDDLFAGLYALVVVQIVARVWIA